MDERAYTLWKKWSGGVVKFRHIDDVSIDIRTGRPTKLKIYFHCTLCVNRDGIRKMSSGWQIGKVIAKKHEMGTWQWICDDCKKEVESR